MNLDSFEIALKTVLASVLAVGCRVEQHDGGQNGKHLIINGVVMVRLIGETTFEVLVVGQNGYTFLDPVDATAAVVAEIAKISAIEMTMMELGLGED